MCFPTGITSHTPTNFPLRLILLRYQGAIWNRMELSMVVNGHFATRHVSVYALGVVVGKSWHGQDADAAKRASV